MTVIQQQDKNHRAVALTVLYDGACPMCRREINIYRGIEPLNASASICFSDVNDAESPIPLGVTREQLKKRFHVLHRDGELFSGARAFLALWASLPGWRWLAFAGRIPGAVWLLEAFYQVFLRVRPTLQRWVRRLDRTS